MFSKIGKRVTYANVAMTLALVFAMSGGAYAASRYVITSTKQISPKVLKSLKGATGKNGANGANGATGPAGPAGTGPAGSTGPAGTGAEGKEGKQGIQGIQGIQGQPGKNGTIGFTKTLPAGETETGVWGLSQMPGSFYGGIVEEATTSISFVIPLSEGLAKGDVHVIGLNEEEGPEEGKAGEGKGDGCPSGSSFKKPAAEPGNLCIFVAEHAINVKTNEIETTSMETEEQEEAGTTGTLVVVKPATNKEPILVRGTWAVTAG